MPAGAKTIARRWQRDLKLLPSIATAFKANCFPLVTAGLSDCLGEENVAPNVTRMISALRVALRGSSSAEACETAPAPVGVEPKLVVACLLRSKRHFVVKSNIGA